MRVGWIAAFAAALLAVGAARAEEPATAYVHVGLIDGTRDGVRRDMAVIVEGERIAAVVASAEVPPGARVVDMSGHTVIPGLIDAHTHLTVLPERRYAEAEMKRDLYGGITAVRDMAGDARILAPLARDARAGTVEGPDLVFAAFMAGRSFFDADGDRPEEMARGMTVGEPAWARAIDADTDLDAAVSAAKATGASGVKVYANLSPAQVKALVDAAHAQGMKAWAHAMVFPTAPAEVLAAGPDTVEHACYLPFQVMDPGPRLYHERERFPIPDTLDVTDNPELTALFTRMKNEHVVFDPTNFVYGLVERMRASIPDGQFKPPIFCSSAMAARVTGRAWRVGVMIAAGTDGPSPPEAPLPSLHDELDILVHRAGMTPMAAIQAATRNSAFALGLQAEMGTIAPGKLANLVFLSASPLDDIAATRKVVLTVKRGREHWRRDYRQPPLEDLDPQR